MAEQEGIIDVWSAGSFDDELYSELDAHSEVIKSYILTDYRQVLERNASDHTMPHPRNPYADDFFRVTELIKTLMEKRIVRAWHYSRMTDGEIETLGQVGIYPATLDNIRSRFAAQVAAGTLSQEEADRLFADSPYQGNQKDARSNKFWMVSHPLEIEDGSVELLLKYWGGEAAYFWQEDSVLLDSLEQIGRPRVLEIATPLEHTRHSYSAAEAVVATFGRTVGCNPEKHAFDLYTTSALGPEHILRVHSAGEQNFRALARGYPAGFVDVNHDRWNDE